MFDSKREAKYYQDLLILKRIGEVKEIECHPTFELQPAYRKCCGHIWLDKPAWDIKGATVCGNCGKKMKKIQAITYSADFRVTYVNGHEEIVDVKGMETKFFKNKRKMFEFHYPKLTLKVIKKQT